MERSFECPICFEQFSDTIKPLLVPCGHTVCSACLQSLVKNKSIECPVCRSIHHNINISALSPNYALIHSEKLTTKANINTWEKIEEVHKQLNILSEVEKRLKSNHDNSRASVVKARAEVTQRFEMISGIIQNLHNKLTSEIDSTEQQIEAKFEKASSEIKSMQTERSEILQGLQAAYSGTADLSMEMKLKVSSLRISRVDIEMKPCVMKSDKNEISEKISSWLGFLEEDRSAKWHGAEDLIGNNEELKVSQRFSDKSNEDRGGFRGRGREDRGRGDDRGRGQRGGRGRGENRDEGAKQPRQPRPEFTGWLVENRFGNWEKLAPWFENQINAAFERNEETVTVNNELNKPSFFVDFKEKKSYMLNRKGERIKFNRIMYQD